MFLLAGGDFAGNLNDNNNALTPIIDLQANVFAKYRMGNHMINTIVRYWGEYDDPSAIDSLQNIDSMTTVDLTYSLTLLQGNLVFDISAFNLFDEDPPRTQTDLNYDPYTHNAFGRMIKAGFRYSFGGNN